jgi:DNA helicase HerA-like ATPase
LRDDAGLAADYQDMTVRAVRQRLSSYASMPVFQGQGTPLTELVVPFRASVLMLARLPDALKKVVVAVLARGILRSRREVSIAQKRLDLDGNLTPEEKQSLESVVDSGVPRTWILMDEAHVLAGSGEASVACEALVKFAKEGRNYGLSLAVATQQPSALDTRLLSQVETIISHQLTAPQDASTAAKGMRSPLPESIEIDGARTDLEGLLRRLGQGEAVFSSGNAPALQRGVVIAIRPRVTAHGGYEA